MKQTFVRQKVTLASHASSSTPKKGSGVAEVKLHCKITPASVEINSVDCSINLLSMVNLLVEIEIWLL